MQFSKKQKVFSEFVAVFLKSPLNFEYFQKKMTLKAFVFSKLRTLKTWLDECLESPNSEDASTSNI